MKRFLWLILATFTFAREEETAAPDAAAKFLTILEAHFSAWDTTHNGELSRNELDALVANQEITGEKAAAVAALKRASRYKKIELPKFTLPALRELTARKPEKNWPNLLAMFTDGTKRITAASKRELFASRKPRIETIHQGRMGNCFSLAPLGAMAAVRPDYIVKEMIRRREDGRFDVKFGAKVVTITAPTDAELAMTAGTESDGIWVNVYEKAAGEIRNEMKPEEERESTGLDMLNKGGSAGTQLAFITGHEMFRLSCKFAKDAKLTKAEHDAKLNEIRAALTSATREGRLITTGTLATKIPGITPGHAYAVLDFDASKDLIRVWNPHGDTTIVKGEPGPQNGYPLTDGVFEMPLTVFIGDFAGLAFEVLPQPAKAAP